MSELKHLKEEWEAIMTCMNCGDCGYSIRPFVGRYLTCPVKEAKGEEGFEIYFCIIKVLSFEPLEVIMLFISLILFDTFIPFPLFVF